MFSRYREPILRQDLHYLQTDQIQLPPETRHLGEPWGASKTISEPMVCSAQTMDLPCTDTNIISKQTEMRFQMTHVT
jgi:hypothetical protein